MSGEEPTHQPARVIAGNCPECGRLCVLFNNHEVWSLFRCSCGWVGATGEVVDYVRRDAKMPWEMKRKPAQPTSEEINTEIRRQWRDVTLTDLLRCPIKSFEAAHYFDDGSCRCPPTALHDPEALNEIDIVASIPGDDPGDEGLDY